MDEFHAEEWQKLTDAERARHCRTAAREAEIFAQLESPGLRQLYKDMAAGWNLLAAEIEQASPIG